MSRGEWQVRLMVAIVAFLGLMVGIDGLLHGAWYRMLGGSAWFASCFYIAVKGPARLLPERLRERLSDQIAKAMTLEKSWPLIAASLIFALMCVGIAAMFLLAPWEILLDLFASRRGIGPAWLEEMGGEWFARLVIAAVCGVAAWAAARTALARYRN